MTEYLRDEAATLAAFTADGWLKTGDMAVRQDDGCFKLVGRIKEMYKSGGYNVYPREVELLLEHHPGVLLSAVIAVRSEERRVGKDWVGSCRIRGGRLQ